MNYTIKLVKEVQVEGLANKELKLPSAVQEVKKFLTDEGNQYSKWFKVVLLDEEGNTLTGNPLVHTLGVKLEVVGNAYGVNRVAKYLKENGLTLEEAMVLTGVLLNLTRKNVSHAINVYKTLKVSEDKTLDDLVLTLTGEDKLGSVADSIYSDVSNNTTILRVMGYFYSLETDTLYILDKEVLKRPTPEQEEEYNIEVVEDTLLEGRILLNETLLRYGVMDETNVTGDERLVTILRNWKYYKMDTDLLNNMTVDVFKGYVEAKGFV